MIDLIKEKAILDANKKATISDTNYYLCGCCGSDCCITNTISGNTVTVTDADYSAGDAVYLIGYRLSTRG